MNGINMNGNGGSAMSNGNGGPAPTGGFLGGMDLTTISALVVLASAFMRR
jgi:hypothetical protein